MHITLAGKKALVGGSSSGIGQAIAIQLASSGAEVYLMARNEEKLQATLSQLCTSHGQKHGYLVTDFLDYDKHKERVGNFLSEHTIDILVNNTNGPTSGTVYDKTEIDYQQAFELLFQTAVWTTMQAVPQMRQKGFGRVINVASMTVKEPQDNLVLSNTMRTALVSWSKSLSNDVAKDGITINTVLTGYFNTDRLTSLLQGQAESSGQAFEDIIAKHKEAIPVRRLGDPAEYGYLVTFLASEYAAFLTGAAIPLDGGAAKTIF